MTSRSSRTVILEPSAELEYRRLADEMPCFEEALEKLKTVLRVRPRRGRPRSGGRWGYALARRSKPRVRVVCTFDETVIRERDTRAMPDDRPSSAEICLDCLQSVRRPLNISIESNRTGEPVT